MKKYILILTLLSLPRILLPAATPASGYTAHEWGTFTSVQGADGIPIEWNPFVSAELPQFVYERNKLVANGLGNLGLAKNIILAHQRMETPVIYFYSATAQTIDVKVDFPKGIITEWYPYAQKVPPIVGISERNDPDFFKSYIEWKGLQIVPTKPNGTSAVAQLPEDGSSSHYYAARATDAAMIRLDSRRGTNGGSEVEKFLFYRGIGSFGTPLKVQLTEGAPSMLNLEAQEGFPLQHLFVVGVREGKAMMIHVRQLDPGKAQHLPIPSETSWSQASVILPSLAQELEQALTQAGLFEREAKAMIKTWQDSWFSESGLRLLYLLPRRWTDHTLPIQLDPRPTELTRVMVGRAEILTPTMQWELTKEVLRFEESDPAGQSTAIMNVRKLGMGRFLEAASRTLATKIPNPAFATSLRDLTRAAATESAKGKVATAH